MNLLITYRFAPNMTVASETKGGLGDILARLLGGTTT